MPADQFPKNRRSPANDLPSPRSGNGFRPLGVFLERYGHTDSGDDAAAGADHVDSHRSQSESWGVEQVASALEGLWRSPWWIGRFYATVSNLANDGDSPSGGLPMKNN